MDDFIQLLCMLAMVGGFMGVMVWLWRITQMDQRGRCYDRDEDEDFWDDIAYLDLLDDEDDGW